MKLAMLGIVMMVVGFGMKFFVHVTANTESEPSCKAENRWNLPTLLINDLCYAELRPGVWAPLNSIVVVTTPKI
jgi:hypothetical protein